MILYGTIINVICIIVGSVIGLLFIKVNERFKETAMKGISLIVILIGLQMAIEANDFIVVLLSILSGALIGEWLKLESKMNLVGTWLERKFSKNKSLNISEGFITATLLFVIGAMAIIGAIESGVANNHSILVTKAVIDGFTSFVLTTTLGIGVILSIVPVFFYQAAISIFSNYIITFIPEMMLDEMILQISVVGGLLIVGLGLNILNVTKIKIVNLLPSILMVIIIVLVKQLILG